ncbi:MAG TPA: replication factor C small subunit [Candidatus Pacearchaeota archaeon]|nr:replication factor C small subunit [Candidatus Pacearchaeota archaeon]
MVKKEAPLELILWNEKYRPKTFDEVVGQKEIVSRLKAFVSAKNMPHLLFSGPPGSGKTTLALIIAKKLFGERWRENFLELNASDERGINVIREKVKDFARTKAFAGPFKIIFLDESDALTREAQQALRRTMEMFTATCRFILSCNAISKIIEPIQSRCVVFRFKPIDKKDVESVIKRIAKKEKFKISQKAIDFIYEVSKGDLRRVINILQSCAAITSNIEEKTVRSIVAEASPEEIKKILTLALKGNFLGARKMLFDLMLSEGLSGLDVIKAISSAVLELDIKEEKKILIVDKCGEIEFRLSEGSDEFLQLEAFLAWLAILKS